MCFHLVNLLNNVFSVHKENNGLLVIVLLVFTSISNKENEWPPIDRSTTHPQRIVLLKDLLINGLCSIRLIRYIRLAMSHNLILSFVSFLQLLSY